MRSTGEVSETSAFQEDVDAAYQQFFRGSPFRRQWTWGCLNVLAPFKNMTQGNTKAQSSWINIPVVPRGFPPNVYWTFHIFKEM